MPKRYLWAVGDGADVISVGQWVGDRYLCKAPRIFLDARPGHSPDTLETIPSVVLPYLKLNAYQLHIPQAYGWAQLDKAQAEVPPILLLERAAIAIPVQQRLVSRPLSKPVSAVSEPVQLLPTLTSQWGAASPMRQLNWLWQIAKLWQPLATERVVSSVLEPNLIRVEGSVIRILELRSDQRLTEGVGASLFHQLGELWQQWVPDANPAIQPFLGALCQHLVEGNIKHPGQLVACLDRALKAAGTSQVRHIQLASQTDQGPSRPRNEDACYPPEPGIHQIHSKRMKKTAAPLDSSLVMVCDGIGGHLGGDVASGLAIDAIYQHLQAIPLGQMSPLELMAELRKAACAANDVISDRNDHEERRDRERMGTTLVMGLVQHHELYITHLGDSRAYLITQAGCHQVTLDDDVASREARLGYGTYRSALAHPGSGSLVQALGMGPSGSLHPTVQRFVLEGEGVMLLCSDGLSDNDLIDSLWNRHLLPLLDANGGEDLAAIANKLVNAANQYNGHDNVTVSLVRWVAQHQSKFKLDAKLATPPTLTSSIPGLSSKTRMQAPASPSVPVTQNGASTKLIAPDPELSSPSSSSSSLGVRSLLSMLLGIGFLLSLGGVLAYVLLPSVSDRIDAWLGIDGQSYSGTPASLDPDEEGSLNPSDTLDRNRLERPLQIGSVIQISRTDLTGINGTGTSPENSDTGTGTGTGTGVGDNGEEDGGDRLPSEPSEPNFDPASDGTLDAAILRLYPEPSFATVDSSTPSPDASSAMPASPDSSAERSNESPATPISSTTTPPSSPEAAPEAAPEADGASAEFTESSASPVDGVTVPTPVTAGTMLRVVGQQEGEGDVRWIRLRVCSVPVKPDEAIVSGETEEPISGVESGDRVLTSGQAGWIPEHQIVTVAVLTDDPDPVQLQGCQPSASP